MVHVGQLADVVPICLQGAILGDVVGGQIGQSEVWRAGRWEWHSEKRKGKEKMRKRKVRVNLDQHFTITP